MSNITNELKYQRVLLKLSGEALMGDETYGIDPKVIDRLAAEISELNKNKKFIINLDGNDIDILEEEILINELPKDNLCINSNRDFI